MSYIIACLMIVSDSEHNYLVCIAGVGQIRASSLAIVTVLLLGIKIGLFSA